MYSITQDTLAAYGFTVLRTQVVYSAMNGISKETVEKWRTVVRKIESRFALSFFDGEMRMEGELTEAVIFATTPDLTLNAALAQS
jgi:hypothetical protein